MTPGGLPQIDIARHVDILESARRFIDEARRMMADPERGGKLGIAKHDDNAVNPKEAVGADAKRNFDRHFFMVAGVAVEVGAAVYFSAMAMMSEGADSAQSLIDFLQGDPTALASLVPVVSRGMVKLTDPRTKRVVAKMHVDDIARRLEKMSPEEAATLKKKIEAAQEAGAKAKKADPRVAKKAAVVGPPKTKPEEHHSDAVFLGGDPKQKTTPMAKDVHRGQGNSLHNDLNDFLRKKTDEHGNHMRPQRGNSGEDIRANFTREERLRAEAEFYKLFRDRYPDAARDFFNQHPGLE